jgi:hypothetical protein
MFEVSNSKKFLLLLSVMFMSQSGKQKNIVLNLANKVPRRQLVAAVVVVVGMIGSPASCVCRLFHATVNCSIVLI